MQCEVVRQVWIKTEFPTFVGAQALRKLMHLKYKYQESTEKFMAIAVKALPGCKSFATQKLTCPQKYSWHGRECTHGP